MGEQSPQVSTLREQSKVKVVFLSDFTKWKMEKDSDVENEIREKLKNYKREDIIFLKSEWDQKISEKDFDFFRKLKGANLHVVYDMLYQSKIKRIRKAKYGKDRYSIILNHSLNYEIEVIVRFDTPKKGLIGVITYIKQKIKHR